MQPERPVGAAPVVSGLMVGAFAGAVLTGLGFAAALLASGEADLPLAWGWAVSAFTVSLFFWSGGLLLLGGPAWLILHRHGHRSRRAAVVLGSALSFAASLPLGLIEGRSEGLVFALAIAVVGALVGWLVWGFIYRATWPA